MHDVFECRQLLDPNGPARMEAPRGDADLRAYEGGERATGAEFDSGRAPLGAAPDLDGGQRPGATYANASNGGDAGFGDTASQLVAAEIAHPPLDEDGGGDAVAGRVPMQEPETTLRLD